MVKFVVWVDDSDATWGQAVWQPPNIEIVVHHEDRITIYPSRRLVIFNEIGDQANHGERDAVTQELVAT